MILDLGGGISADSRELLVIVPLSGRGDPLLREARRQRRIVSGEEQKAKTAVVLSGARRPGGVTENARFCLSSVSSGRLAARARRTRAGAAVNPSLNPSFQTFS